MKYKIYWENIIGKLNLYFKGYGRMESVVIVQNDMREAQECADNLRGSFNVIEVTDDVRIAIDSIRANKPDFLVTSFTLRQSDGIELIELAKRYSPNTCAVVISVMNCEEMVRQIMDAGASYYMIKPVDYGMLIKRMNSLAKISKSSAVSGSGSIGSKGDMIIAENTSGSDEGALDRQIEERISRIFIGMGMPPHIKGYSYLREGIRLAVEEPEIINSVTKRLYPTIGVRYNTSASKVERAIRHAIGVAWNKGHIDTFNSLFGVNAYSASDKPTNSEFIALIADRLLLDGFAAV